MINEYIHKLYQDSEKSKGYNINDLDSNLKCETKDNKYMNNIIFEEDSYVQHTT